MPVLLLYAVTILQYQSWITRAPAELFRSRQSRVLAIALPAWTCYMVGLMIFMPTDANHHADLGSSHLRIFAPIPVG